MIFSVYVWTGWDFLQTVTQTHTFVSIIGKYVLWYFSIWIRTLAEWMLYQLYSDGHLLYNDGKDRQKQPTYKVFCWSLWRADMFTYLVHIIHCSKQPTECTSAFSVMLVWTETKNPVSRNTCVHLDNCMPFGTLKISNLLLHDVFLLTTLGTAICPNTRREQSFDVTQQWQHPWGGGRMCF